MKLKRKPVLLAASAAVARAALASARLRCLRCSRAASENLYQVGHRPVQATGICLGA